MERSSYQHTLRSADAWIAESESRIAASKARMRRLEQFASIRNTTANVILWGIFLICLVSGLGIITLAASGGSVLVLVVLAATVAIGTFALMDYSFIWRMAGDHARRKVDAECSQD